MEEVRILGWRLEIDRETTINARLKYPFEDCDCCYCQNYREAVRSFPRELASLIESLGLNPAKPIEAVEFNKNPDGTHFYSAWFNVVGYIRESPDPTEQATGTSVLKSLSDTIKIGFKTAVDFPDHFPENTFQFEFYTNLPWLLPDLDENFGG
jgi:hypothetical protein